MTRELMFPLTVSNSSLSGSCDFRWYRSKIQHLSKGRESNGDLLAGGMFAAACEIARIAFYTEGRSQDEAIELGKEYILSSPDTGHSLKTNEKVAYTFTKYIKQFSFNKEFIPCKLEDGTYAIEYGFSFDTGIEHPDIPGTNIQYTGRLDGLYETTIGGVLQRYVLDEKTTGRVFRLPRSKIVDLEKEADAFRASGQLIGYAVAARALGVKNVNSALIRRVPLLKDYEPAYELEIPITTYMMDMWLETLHSRVGYLVAAYKACRDDNALPQSLFYPNYGSSCTAWGTACPYMQGCLYKEGEDFLFTTYKQLVNVEENGERINIPITEYKKRYIK